MLQFGWEVPGKSSAWHEFGKVCQRSNGQILMFVSWCLLTLVEKQLCHGEEGFQEMFEFGLRAGPELLKKKNIL